MSPQTRTYLGWAYYLLQMIPLANIGFAMLPLFRATDDLNDIPLTAAQRKLLGLAPSSRPATPNAAYSTPPRYSRTPSVAGSMASNRSYSSSPLSGKGSPALGANTSFSPAGSPSKLIGAFNNNRRTSFATARTAQSRYASPSGAVLLARVRGSTGTVTSMKGTSGGSADGR